VFDEATVALIESGASLVIGLVDADGAPLATRGWGVTVLDATTGTVRLLIDADDEPALALLADNANLALTAGNVRTLEAQQFKGQVLAIEPTTSADDERAAQFFDELSLAIHEADGTAREATERLVPTRYVACMVVFGEMFDQTPGPGAGAPIDGAT
jgi:hypothetical protein